MSLDIKQVIQIARGQFQELLPELAIQTSNIRLEEIEREGRNWAVTLSVPSPNSGSLLKSGLMGLGRTAKVIVVDGTDEHLLHYDSVRHEAIGPTAFESIPRQASCT